MQVTQVCLGQRRRGGHDEQGHQDAREDQLYSPGDAYAEIVGDADRREQRYRGGVHRGLAAADHSRDVPAGEQRSGRCSRRNRRVEPPADSGRGAWAKRSAGVGRHAAGVGMARAECGEGGGERDGGEHEAEPGEQRRRACSLRGEGGQGDDPGAEDCAHVEGHALGHRQATAMYGGDG